MAEEVEEGSSVIFEDARQKKEDKDKFHFSSIWSTRDIQGITNFNRETFLRTTLLEFTIFITFVVFLIMLLPVLRNFEVFFFCNSIIKSFVKAPMIEQNYHLTFETIATHEEFYDYIESTLMEKLYPNSNTSEEQWVLSQNLLIGYPQLRQIRVRNNTCVIPRNIQSKISVCHGPYTYDNLSEDPIGSRYVLKFSKRDKVSNVDYLGILTAYKPPGHYMRLRGSKRETLDILQSLRAETWIDRGTRAVFIDFFLHNPSTNILGSVTLAGEFSMTGGVFTSHQIRTVRLLNYSLSEIGLHLFLPFLVFIIYYCLEEILEILILRMDYFGLFSSYIDLGIVVSGLNIIIVVLICSANDEILKKEVWKNPNYPSNVMYMAYIQYLFDISLAFLVFLTFIKMFKYLSISKTLTKLSRTIYTSTRDLLGYSILFFFVIISFGLLGMLLFGYQVSIFSTLGFSIVALFRMLLGDIDFEYIDDKHSVIGAAYLIIYVVTIYFILMNVFLAIIFESYSKVKMWIDKNSHELYLVDYIKAKFSRKPPGARKKRCSQWAEDMLNQGYPEKAIETVLNAHKRQGIKPDSWLTRHQMLSLSYEVEEQSVTYFNYEKIGLLEKHFDDLQEKLEESVNNLNTRQAEHKMAMIKLVDLINETEGADKAGQITKLVQNELA